MKNLLILLLLVPLFSIGQAHLGLTLNEIKELYPDKTFTIDYTKDGNMYAYTDFTLGEFMYLFENNVSVSNVMIPNSMINLNTQIQIYNNKYVIISENKWKAYLEGGNSMSIELIYDKEYETYLFIYKQ